MQIDVSPENLLFFEALSSGTRLQILRTLGDGPRNIGELSAGLGVSSAIVTRHIRQLEEAGLVAAENRPGKRGMQKLCRLNAGRVALRFREEAQEGRRYRHSVGVGRYVAHKVRPTCGLLSDSAIIGLIDEPRYFDDPGHFDASLIWFGSGYVQYRLPYLLLSNETPESLEISLEICSEAPGYDPTRLSDIHFSVNGVPLGMWTSPGDFGEPRGQYTPTWWDRTQYGLLKTVTVNGEGSFVDGVRTSDAVIGDLGLAYGQSPVFTVSSPPDARNPGGITLFGKGFGNYPQDIVCVITCKS